MWKRLGALWAWVRHDVRLLWFALQHPQSPDGLKIGATLLALYLISPLDLIPDLIPWVGWVDDLVLVPLLLRWMLSRLPAEVRQWAEARARGENPGGLSITARPESPPTAK